MTYSPIYGRRADLDDVIGWKTDYFSSHLPVESLKRLVQSLLTQLPESTSPRVIVVKPEMPAPSPVRPNGVKARPNTPAYEPSVLFILELATTLTIRDAETIEALGKDVANALEGFVRDATLMHPLVLARVIYYLLTLIRVSNVSSLHVWLVPC